MLESPGITFSDRPHAAEVTEERSVEFPGIQFSDACLRITQRSLGDAEEGDRPGTPLPTTRSPVLWSEASGMLPVHAPSRNSVHIDMESLSLRTVGLGNHVMPLAVINGGSGRAAPLLPRALE